MMTMQLKMSKGPKKTKPQKAATVRKGKAAAPPKAKKPKPAAAPVQRDDPVDEIEIGDDDLEFADEHEGFLEKFVSRFREEDLAPKKKDDKKAEKRQQKRQDEQQARRVQEKEAIDAAVAESNEGPDDENKPAQKEKAGKKRKLAADDGLRVPSTKAWNEGEVHQGPIKERLPIKTIEGRVIRQLEKLPTREEQAEERRKQWEEDEKRRAAQAEARQKKKEEEEEAAAEEEEEDYGEDDGLLDEEVVARPVGEGVANVSATIDSSLAALRQQGKGTGADMRAMRQARLELKKIELATLCEAVLEDPEGSVLSKTEGSRTRVGHLLSLLDDDDKRVQELAMISLLAVFKDIMPTYRIRLPTDKEMATKVSKEVKRMRDYERALLGGYQAYLKHLEKSSKLSTASGSGDRGVALVGVRCLCGLLPSMAHFNFATNLLNAVVALALKTPDAQVRDACCLSLRRLVERDQQGDMSLAAAKLICQEVKARRLMAPEEVVRVLHHLKLLVKEDDADVVKGRAAAQNNKLKKRRREDEKDKDEGEDNGIEVDEADIKAGLKEAEARADPVLRARCQVDALQEVTVLYFRVLKQTAGRPVLLPVVLEGLAKIAHLINLETVQDVIEVLRDLLDASSSSVEAEAGPTTRPRLPLHACLNGVLTALRTLQGPGRELKQDDRAFVVFLYRQLGRMSEYHGCRHLPLLITCVRAALIDRREYSLARVAAFHKRLCTLALHLSHPRDSRALLCLAKELALRYGDGVVERLLEGEADRVSMGIYRPDVDDPDLCNPLAAALWDLSLLRLHVHPAARRAASDVLSGAAVASSRFQDATRVAGEPEEVCVRGFNGWFTRLPKANPLHAMVRKAERDAKGKKAVKPYFIRAPGAAADVTASVTDRAKVAAVLASGGLPLLSTTGAGKKKKKKKRAAADMKVDEEQDGAPSFRPLFREVRRHEMRLRLCRKQARLQAAHRVWLAQQAQAQKEKAKHTQPEKEHGRPGKKTGGKEAPQANGLKAGQPGKKQRR